MTKGKRRRNYESERVVTEPNVLGKTGRTVLYAV
jgi:hypothetical protein